MARMHSTRLYSDLALSGRSVEDWDLTNSRFFLPLDDDDQEELDLSDDLWRVCPSYPDYEASYNGWVRTWRAKGGRRRVHPLYHEGRRINVLAEDDTILNRSRGQLVADAFLVQPEPHWNLFYLDGNNQNFKATNLTWEPRQNRVSKAVAMGKHFGRNKTHCVHGHPLSGEDAVRITSDGSRMCLVCARAHSSMYQERRRLKLKGLPFEHVTFEYVLKRKGVWVDSSSLIQP